MAAPRPSDARRAWIVSWVAYATYYAGRKGFSVAKRAIERDLSVSRDALAAIDTGYLTFYATGQLASGLLSDRIGARKLVGWGMIFSAACCLAFGASSTALGLGVAFALNGLAQSTGWPGTTRAMAEWTTPANRRRVMALFSTSYQFGGIAATAVAAFLLSYGWRATFFVPAVALALGGCGVLALLMPGPEAPDERRTPSTPEDLALRREAMRAALRSRVLLCFGSSYFAIKLIRYSLLFWLPYYLSTELGYEEGSAGYLSTAFELGGVVGVVGAGYATDRLREVPRPVFCAALLVGLTGALFSYTRLAPLGAVPNALGLALVGALLFGPDSILSGAAAQDAGGPLAAATATGLVNAVGSVGAILQGPLNAWVSRAFGWRAVFLVLVALAFAAALALVPTFRRDDRA
ncbi:MAG TPA: MFS transporter [Polyangiaceae bacterium]